MKIFWPSFTASGRRKGTSGRLPSSRRGADAQAMSMLRTSFVPGAGDVMICQLLLIRIEPARNASLLPGEIERLLRRMCGVATSSNSGNRKEGMWGGFV